MSSAANHRLRLAGLAGALLACLLLGPVGLAHAASIPKIRHVFTIVLENEDASTTFGPNPPAPYLATTLRAEGAYLPNYYGIGHNSLDNYLAMISGQAPNPTTQADCPIFSDFAPGTIGAAGQAIGTGCVYPSAVPTVAGQLAAAHFSWRSYNESMGADPTRESATCGHPGSGVPRQHRGGHGDRPVRHPSRPVRLLPLDHRQRPVLRQPRGEPERPRPTTSRRSRRRPTTRSSPPTSAPTATTPPAPTRPGPAATAASTPSSPPGCPRSWPLRRISRMAW